MAISRIIDKENDTTYCDEIRTLLGITSGDIPDSTIEMDIILGLAEREVCKIYVPNWIDVLNGDDTFAVEALRTAVLLKVCLNILDSPAIQNLIIVDMKIEEIVLKNDIDTDKLKASLLKMFESQLSLVGVERTVAWPEHTVISLTDVNELYQYAVDLGGDIVEI